MGAAAVVVAAAAAAEGGADRRMKMVRRDGEPKDPYHQGWAAAVQLAHALNQGATVPTQATTLVLAEGETFLCTVQSELAAYHGLDVQGGDGGFFAFGETWKGLTATAGLSYLYNKRQQSKAEQQAATQWRSYGYVDLHLTDQRLVVPIEGQWTTYGLAGDIVGFEPYFHEYRAIVRPNGGTPLHFRGPAVPYLSVLLHWIFHRSAPQLPVA